MEKQWKRKGSLFLGNFALTLNTKQTHLKKYLTKKNKNKYINKMYFLTPKK